MPCQTNPPSHALLPTAKPQTADSRSSRRRQFLLKTCGFTILLCTWEQSLLTLSGGVAFIPADTDQRGKSKPSPMPKRFVAEVVGGKGAEC